MNVSIVVAMGRGGVIGAGNRLPWHIPEDLRRFKALTMGHPLIMGRKTFESIGRPLPGRTNIVLTGRPDSLQAGVHPACDLKDAFRIAKGSPGADEVFVIGGERLFREALPLTRRLYLTSIDQDFKGDVFFPPVDIEAEFEVSKRQEICGPFPLTFLILDRRGDALPIR